MLRLLIDHDVDHDILRGLRRRVPQLDAVTALDVGMSESSDRELLVWAAREGRDLITHDRKTMPRYAAALLKEGKSIAGLLVVSRRLPLHQALKNWSWL